MIAPDAPPLTCCVVKPCMCGWYQYSPGGSFAGIWMEYCERRIAGFDDGVDDVVLMANRRYIQTVEVHIGRRRHNVISAAIVGRAVGHFMHVHRLGLLAGLGGGWRLLVRFTTSVSPGLTRSVGASIGCPWYM